MTTKIKDIIFFSIARGLDLLTTALCLNVFGYDLSTEAGFVSRVMLHGTGFVGLILLNIIIIVLLGLEYGKLKKIRVWLIMRIVGVVSLLFAGYNLLVYLSALELI